MSASLLTTMADRLDAAPGAPLYTFLDRHGKEIDAADRQEIVRRAAGTADLLQAAGVAAGDRVLLIFPPDGLEFVAGFFGCMLLGAIAVPVASPDPRHLDRELPKLRHIAEDSGARVALTHAKYRALTTLASVRDGVAGRWRGREMSSWPEFTWLLSHRAKRADPEAAAARLAHAAARFGPDDVVYLQYTSGSTSEPRGVVVRHRNLTHNLELIARNTRVDSESVLIGWVPLFHDMGLAGGILNAMYTGARCIAFSSMTFLADPRLWLEAIDRYRGTHIAGPNFGYDYVLRGLRDGDSFDLSSVRSALQGGEPMLAATMDRFEAAFSRMGFDPASFGNVYGMAEAVLFVCGRVGRKPTLLHGDRALLDRDGVIVAPTPGAPTVTLVGSGVPDAEWGVSVIAVDPVTRRPRPPYAVGELWISSPSVSSGYWGRTDQENAAVFAARPATGNGPDDGRRFLRTGDLGVIGDDGEVFLCGRLKDLIIVGGRNIHPQDLEAAVVAADPILRPGNAVAFGVRVDGAERVVVAAEVRKKVLRNRKPIPLDRAASAIRAAVTSHCGVQCHEVLLMTPDSIPKTTSGKLRRTQSKHQWTVGSLRSSAISGQRGPARARVRRAGPDGEPEYVLRLLQTEVAEVLHLSDPNDVSVDRPLSDVGLDSLGLIDLARRVEDRTGACLPPASFGNDATLRTMAISVLRHFEPAPPDPGEAPGAGDVPFSAAQRHALELGQWDGWTRTVMLDVHQRLTPDRLRRAASALVARHEALRLRFRRDGGRFAQHYGDIEGSFAVESVTLDRPDALAPLLSEQHRRVSLEHGPLMRLLLIATGSRQRLFIAVNHLVMDGVTLRILLDDLDQLCRLDEQGEALRLARTSARFEVFSGWMNDFAGRGAKADLEFWRTQLAVPPPATYDPLAHPGVRVDDLEIARHRLPPEQTRALRNVRMTGPNAGRAPLAITLLTALVRTAGRQWNCGRLVVELSGSGRQAAVHGLDLARTAGDLHCTFPLAFEDSRSQGPAETLTAVSERLAAVPSGGLSFGGLKYLNDDPDLRESIRRAPAPTLWFDFQGEMPTRSRSGLFSLSAAAVGDVRDPGTGMRQPPLSVACSVVGGTTRIVWEYSPRRLWWTGAEIDQWMTRFRDELSQLALPARQTSR
ncbi:AMP-binding protein [Paractinoplanes atraurantiacus]|uniref:Non-ribosomal peptide synthase domain TIGR01720 n=1 Tax=Paractinoplanes atraurantiacus TaxID=1036182 RepID=A0A285GNH4_9ACTN|nr:AMP-binding protein [Actinoplanes atraurantiacus]SNY25122.1 non-ribosomal peptide synthase domain TIGR01720 [Actinoplanes atraurantiacus]